MGADVAGGGVAFDAPDLLANLDALTTEGLDVLPWGVIVMDRTGRVTGYNRSESDRSGLSAARVIGRHFFTDVGPCTDNELIARRFEDAARRGEPLDVSLDYVFSFRLRPTPVRLRLLAGARAPRQYLVVRSR